MQHMWGHSNGTGLCSAGFRTTPTPSGSQNLASFRTAATWASLGLALALLAVAMPATAAPPSYAERLYARAVDSFRQGRFPEAYGRFIELANDGHPASARYALWMCEQGPPLFGKDWDCASHEVEEWARVSGVTPPQPAINQPIPLNVSQRRRGR